MESGKVDSGFAGRLKQVVKTYGSASSLAVAIGRSEGAVRNWLAGRTEPTVSDVLNLCRVTGTTVDWLMTGEGPRGAQQLLELRESRVEYQAGVSQPNGPIDGELLQAIAEVIEKELSAHQLTLAPEKKAALLVESYRFLGRLEKFDAETVIRLVRLAS